MRSKDFQLVYTSVFVKSYQKFLKKNRRLQKRTEKTLIFLRKNPYHPGLRTHQVITSQFGKVNSTRVTGDIRILWSMESHKLLIFLLDMGTHSGNKNVYK